MASSSSSGIVASPVPNHGSYDVFLSFRGEDTRNNFTDHLYEALKRANIRPFRDDDDIKRGEELKPEIEGAIKESRASIVVLSKNYATSTWCLDELQLILEHRRECNHFVLPVFYDVDPSDVETQQNSFAIVVQSSGRWTQHNVNVWKAALTEVASLAGLVLDGLETKLLKKIVDTIYDKLDFKLVRLPSNLTGMDARYEDIKSWLEQPDAQFLIIYGMVGSGKTTLAKYILDSNWQNFENISFLEDFGSHDLVQLQEKLLLDILGGKKRKIPSVLQRPFTIEEALETKRSLIILDYIVEQGKLEALLGTGKINRQTKIIITTILNKEEWFKSRAWRCQKYEIKLLNDDESLELLSRHAFRSKTPMEGFEDLAVKALQYCGGNPLALEVLGSSLFDSSEGLANRNGIQIWESALNLLETEMDSGIFRVHKRSYNSLPYDSYKELFLHIACFFVGIDMDYVIKILQPDYFAFSGIKTLINRCLLSVSPNNKLMMHRLLQQMGRRIVHQESPKDPVKRSRVWHNKESYYVLRGGEGSKSMEGLALDMQMLREEEYQLEPIGLKTDSLTKMDNLKLLQLKYVRLTGYYKKFSRKLRWLCWHGFHLSFIPSGLFMGNMVAIDMSYSNLEEFEPPVVLKSLQVLNLKGSHKLSRIRNISRLPNLEILVLWNCRSLTHVCETIGGLKSLVQLNMTGCKRLFKGSLQGQKAPLEVKKKEEKKDDSAHIFFFPDSLELSSSLEGQRASTGGGRIEKPTFFLPHSLELSSSLKGQRASTSGGRIEQPTFFLPQSLERLLLNDCNLECTDYFPLSFDVQFVLQYLNLANSQFEILPNYNHLTNLRVLDLSFCLRLKWLLCLPSTLAELYTYHCRSLEKITFESRRFTLQEFGCGGCINLAEIEGFLKLVPLAKLDDTDLGHMKWLKEYQNLMVCLVSDDELAIGRSWHIQMLYEFNIMSTSLPDIKDPNMTPEYISGSQSLSFDLPLCPKNRQLKGLNVSFKYTISSEDWVWFAKISTNNGVDLMYNPKVFGKPTLDEVAIWVSYWPIGNALDVGDKVYVSIVVMSGLKVHECGASLVYNDDDVTKEMSENNMGWVEILGGDLSGFQLSTGAYYLCRRNFFELMEVGILKPDWFSILVGDTTDCAEVRGWRNTGRPKQLYQSFTESKIVKCHIHGPKSVDAVMDMSKASVVDDDIMKELMRSAPIYNEKLAKRKMMLSVNFDSQTQKDTVMKAVNVYGVIDWIVADFKNGRLSAFGDDNDYLKSCLKIFQMTIKIFETAHVLGPKIPINITTKGLRLGVNFNSQVQKMGMMNAVSAIEGIDLIVAYFRYRTLVIHGNVHHREIVYVLSNFVPVQILGIMIEPKPEISEVATKVDEQMDMSKASVVDDAILEDTSRS